MLDISTVIVTLESMLSSLLSHSLVAVGLLVLIVLVLLVAVLFMLIKQQSRLRQLAYPVYEQTVKKAQQTANEIIAQAQKEARSLRVEGELKGIKAVARDKTQAQDVLEDYERELDELMEHTKTYVSERGEAVADQYEQLIAQMRDELKQQTQSVESEINQAGQRLTDALGALEQQANDAQGQYTQLTENLSSSAKQNIQESEAYMKRKLDELMEELRESMKKVEAESRETIRQRLEEQFDEAQRRIDTYRQARMRVIDKHIVEIVEEAAAIALQKSISVSEHADLVRNALEEARQEGVFGTQKKNNDQEN